MNFAQKSAENPRQSLISQNDIDVLFEQMIKAYAQTFISRYGIVDSGIWLSTLAHLTPSELKIGLGKMAQPGTKFSEFPPTPFSFRDLCRPIQESAFPAAKFYPIGLPKPPTDKELAAKALRHLRFVTGILK